MKKEKSSNISATALHRFIPQPASGRSSALPCLAANIVLSKLLWEIHLHGLKFIPKKLRPLNQVVERDDYNLGAIPNLHSLIPYSLAAKKPVYKCTSSDGLKGTHISKARESATYYNDVIEIILNLLDEVPFQ